MRRNMPASKPRDHSLGSHIGEIKIAHEPPMPDIQASCDGKNIRKLPMPVRWCYRSPGPPPVEKLKSA